VSVLYGTYVIQKATAAAAMVTRMSGMQESLLCNGWSTLLPHMIQVLPVVDC